MVNRLLLSLCLLTLPFFCIAEPADSMRAEGGAIVVISDTSSVVDETDLGVNDEVWPDDFMDWVDNGESSGLWNFLTNALGVAGVSMMTWLLLSLLIFLALPLLLIILLIWLLVRNRRQRRRLSHAPYYSTTGPVQSDASGDTPRQRAVRWMIVGAIVMAVCKWVVYYKFGLIIGLVALLYGAGEYIIARKNSPK